MPSTSPCYPTKAEPNPENLRGQQATANPLEQATAGYGGCMELLVILGLIVLVGAVVGYRKVTGKGRHDMDTSTGNPPANDTEDARKHSP